MGAREAKEVREHLGHTHGRARGEEVGRRDWQTDRGWAGKDPARQVKGSGLYADDAGMQAGILGRHRTQAGRSSRW